MNNEFEEIEKELNSEIFRTAKVLKNIRTIKDPHTAKLEKINLDHLKSAKKKTIKKPAKRLSKKTKIPKTIDETLNDKTLKENEKSYNRLLNIQNSKKHLNIIKNKKLRDDIICTCDENHLYKYLYHIENIVLASCTKCSSCKEFSEAQWDAYMKINRQKI